MRVLRSCKLSSVAAWHVQGDHSIQFYENIFQMLYITDLPAMFLTNGENRCVDALLGPLSDLYSVTDSLEDEKRKISEENSSVMVFSSSFLNIQKGCRTRFNRKYCISESAC